MPDGLCDLIVLGNCFEAENDDKDVGVIKVESPARHFEPKERTRNLEHTRFLEDLGYIWFSKMVMSW